MTSYERILLALQHREADRIPIHDSYWGTTLTRWRGEGLPDNCSPHEYFNLEIAESYWDDSLQLPSKTLDETEETVVSIGADGATVKNWKTQASTPELLDFTIKSRADWEEYKPRLTWNETRVDWVSRRLQYDEARRKGLFYTASIYTGFTRICDMCGTDRVLMAMLDDPEWIQDMLLTRARLCVDIAEEMFARGFDFDAGWIADDLGFKQRSFFSPATYRELVMPAHALICDYFKSRGKWMLLHSCGYIVELLPLIIETGFDCLQPLEVKAGNNLLTLKQQYGDRLSFMGGIDVRAMADPDPAVMEREIAEKIPVAKQGGGYLYHSDHSIPDNVSFQQYCRVMELVAQYGKY